jgi:murein DD-endopeptidase MepM/ murein hydrolase activator NlpD
MINSFSKFLIIMFVVLLLGSQIAFAQESQATENSDPVIDEVDTSKKLDEIKGSLNNTETDLKRSVNDTSVLEQRLGDATDLIQTLEGQLKNIDEQFEKTEKRIVLITLNLTKNKEKLEALMSEISILVRQIESQKEKLQELLLLIYFQSEQVGFFDPEDLQTIKLLLADNEISDMLHKADNLSILEYALADLVTELDISKDKLVRDKEKVEKATKELQELQKALADEQVFLALQRTAKESLLQATQGEEALYSQLLEKAREEQSEIRREFVDLVQIYSQYKNILGQDGFATDDFSTSDVLSWPIAPSLGISAYFRDPSYRAALGVQHNAIDIRAPQGSTVYAPADGVVLKAKGGEGNDYHYIVIGHNEEVMTLFGHMYDIFVSVGQSVKRGDPIGLSGGLPGSRGAGWLTTGPHLHFEVLQDGKHVNPYDFLDLDALPDKYQK